MRKIALPLILFIAVISWGLFPGCSLTDSKEEEGMWNTPGIPPPTLQSFPRWHPTQDKILYYNHGVVKYDPAQNRTTHEADSTGLWMMNADGSGKRKLLDGQSIYADWSPSGDSIVFEHGAQIYKARFNGQTIDTASIQQITFEGRNFFPAWSPNGKWVTYSQSICNEIKTCGIWLFNLIKNFEINIVKFGNYPDWHSSGKEILYRTRAVTSTGEVIGDSLWTFNLTDSTSSYLTFIEGTNRYPKYSPNGKQIVVQSDNQVWVMDADGSNPKQLNEHGGMPDWSPEGNQIVYIGPKKTIWVMNADGTNPRQLTVRPEGEISEENLSQ